MWALLAVGSAFFLGIYDIFKKLSLNNNAVIPVLFFSILASSTIFLPLILLSAYFPQITEGTLFHIPIVPLWQHTYFFLKSLIVTSSWIFAFFALKHLPITIVAPIRATGPMWTLLGAILIYSEYLTIIQWIGTLTILTFFYLFSLQGKLEGIHFRSNKWVVFIIIGTLLGAISALYDKYLIHNFDRMAVQSWSTIYQVILLAPVMLFLWYPKRSKNTPFQWRWTIPMIGLVLLVADFLYFYALSYEGSFISVISALRRCGVVISFLFGGWIFHERNVQKKGWLLLGIMAGVIILLFGTR